MNPFRTLGLSIIALVRHAGGMVYLFVEMVYWLGDAPRSRRRVALQTMEVGVRSLPISVFMAVFVGMVLALQSGEVLQRYGSTDALGQLVGLSLVVELAPVLTAILVAGRVGSAMAAEIGAMQVYDEVPSLVSLGINPVRYLAMPRLVACAVSLPILVVFANLVGIAGGSLIAWTQFGIPFEVFYDRVRQAVEIADIRESVMKAFSFGLIIAVVGCHQGFATRGGAEGVGRSTTRSVVIASILIIVCDYFLIRFL